VHWLEKFAGQFTKINNNIIIIIIIISSKI